VEDVDVVKAVILHLYLVEAEYAVADWICPSWRTNLVMKFIGFYNR
jgi:hypothetical protein